jgi:hypothetical protein
VSPAALKQVGKSARIEVGEDGLKPECMTTLIRLQGHIIDHHRQEFLQQWSHFVQVELNARGIRLRNAEALQMTRYYCHASWDEGKTLESPAQIVSAVLEAMGIMAA